MTLFNQSIYDLNRKRGYVLADATGFPVEFISDMKLAVPNMADRLQIDGLFVQGESVRLTFSAIGPDGIRPIAHFSSNEKSMLKLDENYPITSLIDGYGGVIVFGPSLHAPFDLKGPFPVSEECLTRYKPSSIPYAGLTCDARRMTGDLILASGDSGRLVSDAIDVPSELFGVTRAIRIAPVDSHVLDQTNPMLALANGTNSYAPQSGSGRTPIFRLFGAQADLSGTVFLRLDEHFHAALIGLDPDIPSSRLAIGSDLTTDDICRTFSTDPSEDAPTTGDRSCDPTKILFETILVADP